MKLLLDTHAFLWFVGGNTRLSTPARSSIEDPANQSFISVASLWEMAVKISLGKLHIEQPYETFIPRQMARNGFHPLPIDVGHAAALISLPFHHRDPFDRLLVAQAKVEHLAVVSRDSMLDAYGITRLW